MKRSAFLNRKGEINRDSCYVHRRKEFELTPRPLEALRRLPKLDFTIAVVTNQPGIGRGYHSVETFDVLMGRFIELCADVNIELHFLFCSHAPINSTELCTCWKTQPMMFLLASRELGLDLKTSIMIGDRLSDIEAAFAADVPNRLLVGGHSDAIGVPKDLITGSFGTLLDCVDSLPSKFQDRAES